MFYTLLKFLVWGLILAVIGGCIGWALRSLKCRGEVARAKTSTVDHEEVDRMRHRLANLEQVVAERDRLRIQLADVRHADSPGIVGAEIPEPTDPEPTDPEPDVDAEATPAAEEVSEIPSDADVGTVPEEAGADVADVTGVAEDTASIVSDVDDADAAPADSSATVAGFADVGDEDADESVDESVEGQTTVDLDAAAAALGKKIELDDLTVVEGIGPKISELCSGIGITTWRQLADVDVADLQSMLDAAGSRYAVHKPATWPHQAELLATGRWAEFQSLTDELDSGK